MAYHNFNMRSGTPVFPINTNGGAQQACMRTAQAQRTLQIGGSHLIPLPAMRPTYMCYLMMYRYFYCSKGKVSLHFLVPTFE